GVAEEEDVVREQIGMDDALLQVPGPARLELVELARDLVAEPWSHPVGASSAHLEQWPPAGDRKGVPPGQWKPLAGEMKFGERLADCRAVLRPRPAYPHSGKEGDDGRRPPSETAERSSHPVPDRERAVDAARSEMLHQAEKEGEVGRIDPLLV